MPKYLVEFIGTFFLVLTIGFAVVKPGADAMAPVAIGSILMTMIFAGGHVSGAHYNPAVSLAAFVRGKLPAADLVAYWIVQIAAAIVAAGVVIYVKGHRGAPPEMPMNVVQALIVEFLYTFALCYVVLNVATAKGTAGNSFYGLAIGFTVLAGAYSVGAISSAAFNPAVAVAITIMNLQPIAAIWVYFVANLAAGVCAGLAFKAIHPGEE
jgi:aquaporin Z